MLSGKKTVKDRFKEYDDKNLQDIFKELYGKAKDNKPTASGILNSAKSSIGSLGSRLEQRRAKFRDAVNIDKEFDQAAAGKAASSDETSTPKTEPTSAADTTEQEPARDEAT